MFALLYNQGSGIISIAARSGSIAKDKNSNALSTIAESLPSSSTISLTLSLSSPKMVAISSFCLARIQFTLPLIVLISPLCINNRLGCARFQLGKVFVLKRE